MEISDIDGIQARNVRSGLAFGKVESGFLLVGWRLMGTAPARALLSGRRAHRYGVLLPQEIMETLAQRCETGMIIPKLGAKLIWVDGDGTP
jgi:hypothetical protein